VKTASLCASLVAASIRGQMQYRLNFVFEVLWGMAFQSIGFVFILIVLGQFESIAGWTLSEVALLYGIRLLSHGMWTVSFSRLIWIDRMVREGEFDRMLIRPVPMMAQLMFTSFRIAPIGDLLGGVIVLAWAFGQVDIDWSIALAAFFVAALVGGAMLDGAFQLGPAALSFRTLESMSVRIFFDDVFNRFAGYPTSIFSRSTQMVLTWIVPVAFVAWVPASVLLGKTGALPFPAWLAWCSPLLGVAVMAVAVWLFLSESRHYQSSGS
jgi:ABC-2 type transport system permease protein